ncbi:gluconokinase [Nocardioides sp. CBS4Y-1]|uniref:Gluconokinase n=2 Tax=Nocardioides acrostichi TaxID=2784339 RepID=A0A930Y967_9ACTN|nr:gluconokinase [Nocardioides acrostichi]
MGVSGSGKSVVGAALAGRLGVAFEDADDLHPRSNVEKMSRGVPLDDHDRMPWLETIGAWLAAHPTGGVMSCSALKRSYRDVLRRQAPDTTFLHLDGEREVIARRQASRPGHFMPPSLLDSQFAVLEPLADDEPGVVVDVARPVDAIVDELSAALAPRPNA